jgi:hypothetical protein
LKSIFKNLGHDAHRLKFLYKIAPEEMCDISWDHRAILESIPCKVPSFTMISQEFPPPRWPMTHAGGLDVDRKLEPGA